MQRVPRLVRYLIALGIVLVAGILTFLLLPANVPIDWSEDGTTITDTMSRVYVPLISLGTFLLLFVVGVFIPNSKNSILGATLFALALDGMFLVVALL